MSYNIFGDLHRHTDLGYKFELLGTTERGGDDTQVRIPRINFDNEDDTFARASREMVVLQQRCGIARVILRETISRSSE